MYYIDFKFFFIGESIIQEVVERYVEEERGEEVVEPLGGDRDGEGRCENLAAWR